MTPMAWWNEEFPSYEISVPVILEKFCFEDLLQLDVATEKEGRLCKH